MTARPTTGPQTVASSARPAAAAPYQPPAQPRAAQLAAAGVLAGAVGATAAPSAPSVPLPPRQRRRRRRSPTASILRIPAPVPASAPAGDSSPHTPGVPAAGAHHDAGGMSRKGGFLSKAQWRWAFASHQPWARDAAHKTAGGKGVRYNRLPRRKRSSVR